MIDRNDPRLTDYVLGELNSAEMTELHDAIADSVELQNAVEEIRQTAMLLDAAYQSEEPLRLHEEQKAEIAHLQMLESARELKPTTRSRPWLPIVLAASLLGLLVSSVIYLQEAPVSTEVATRVDAFGKRNGKQLESLRDQAEKRSSAKKTANAINLESDDEKYDLAPAIASQNGEMAPRKVAENRVERMKEISALREEEQWWAMANPEVASAPADDSKPSGDMELTLERNRFLEDGVVGGVELRGGIEHLHRLDFDSTNHPNSNGDVANGSGTIVGRDPGASGRQISDLGGEISVEERSTQMRKMQQLAGGGGFGGGIGGKPDGVEFPGSYSSDDEIPGRMGGGPDRSGSNRAGEKSNPEYEGRLGGGVARSPDSQLGKSSPNGRESGFMEPGKPVDPFNSVVDLLEDAKSQSLGLRSLAEQRVEKLGVDLAIDGQTLNPTAPLATVNGERSKEIAVVETESAQPLPDSKAGALMVPLVANGGSAADGDLQPATEREELVELEKFGLRFETRMQSRQETRTVPVQRTRPEIRTREVELGDGTAKTENYTVEVPYFENVIQNYTVELPQIVVDIEPESASRLVEILAKQINPGDAREIGIDELIDKTRELKESLEAKAVEADKDVLLAIRLLDQLSEGDGKKSDYDMTLVLEKVREALQQRNAKLRKLQTWKRVKAIPNTTRLMIGDKDELDLTGMQVNVQVDGFRARVLLDYFYYNDRPQALEGNFKLRLPDDASLFYFAFGESAYDLHPNGELAAEEFLDQGTEFVSLSARKIRVARQDAWKNVKESRMVPREKAAHAFRETVRQKVDPALVEWSGAGVFNARVFPLAAHKLHRIVIGYDVNLTRNDTQSVYELDLPEQTGQCQVDINVQPITGVEYTIEPNADPVENWVGGKTQRRYRFEGPQNQTIRLAASNLPETLLSSAEGFWGVQVTPDLPMVEVAGNPRAIFMVDTSLSSNPDKFNIWLKLLESTLIANRGSLQQFNVVFFNVDVHFWQEKWIDNTPENTRQLLEKCNTLTLEGATDLYGAIETVSKSDWVHESADDVAGKPVAGPDLFLLSDGAVNWGETNLRLIRRKLQDEQFGSLFAYQTGLTGTAISELRFLAGGSGGAVFSVATEAEIKVAATAHRKRPWKLESITAAGASDFLSAGRVQWVYPGQAITIVGRGNVQGELKLEFNQSGQTKTTAVAPFQMESELASRMYGQVSVGQLESLGAEVFDVAASYARHFRVTGETCSLLMLESEADYQRFDIKPQEDLFVIKTKTANELVVSTLRKSASELSDPKAQLMAWLSRLETLPGMNFKMPTALKLAMDDIQITAISQPLDCRWMPREELSQDYLAAIEEEQLDYDIIEAEANRRGRTSVDDAIKVFSSLVERNPGDFVIARDVAFTALEMGRPAQAYHLLRGVAKARPFESSIYPALGQCLTQLGQPDMAIVYYEVALGGSFDRMGEDFQKIVSAEYMSLLHQIVDGKLESSVREFAKARLETLKKQLQFESADLLITMMWNTNETDVDLHVFEPSGEECSYENRNTRSGGQITSDITTGFGPEMYFNPQAPNGKYEIKVKYFASNRNRTEMRNKVHLTIYRGFGTPEERVTRKTVQLKRVGEKESVATVGVE